MTMVSKEYVIEFLKNNYYCKLKPSLIHGVGVFAIKDIPKGINPFTPFEHNVSFDFMINELSEVEGVRDEVLFEKYLLLKGTKDPNFDSIDEVDKFYSKATPGIIDKVLIGIYRCMAWTKEEQQDIAAQFQGE